MTIGEVKKRFGSVIRNQRIRLQLSQEELGELAGLHRTYISDVERGARNLSLEAIDRLASALKLSISTLFTHAGNGGGPDDFVEILLVEDNSRDIELTLRAFRKARMSNRVHVVRDGVEALDFLFSAGLDTGRALPGVILLDLNLPKIDGLEVLRRIKADRRTRDIPVIVLTASERDSDIAVCRQHGVESYIVKPVGFQNFSEVTQRLQMEWALKRPARSHARDS
jgi:CheY-like chemotaxis protein